MMGYDTCIVLFAWAKTTYLVKFVISIYLKILIRTLTLLYSQLRFKRSDEIKSCESRVAIATIVTFLMMTVFCGLCDRFTQMT